MTILSARRRSDCNEGAKAMRFSEKDDDDDDDNDDDDEDAGADDGE